MFRSCCLSFCLWFGLVVPVFADAPPLRIVTSIKPLQLLAVAVTGEPAMVELLLDPRVSPHHYQLRPSERDRLARASVVFWVGPALETFLQSALASLPPPTRVVALQDQARVSGDAHIWMDPIVAIAIARRMADVLSELAPAQRQRWHDNSERLAVALRADDALLRQQLQGLSHPLPYLVMHDAYRHFEARYGLAHAAAVANDAEHAPGARNLLHIEQLLEGNAIQCIFREIQYEPKVLQRLIQGRNVRVVTLDPMAVAIAPTADGIVTFYREFGQTVISCLQP